MHVSVYSINTCSKVWGKYSTIFIIESKSNFHPLILIHTKLYVHSQLINGSSCF